MHALTASCLVSIIYFIFDLAFLKYSGIVEGCSGWCGIENVVAAIGTFVVGFFTLIILRIKKIHESSLETPKRNLAIIINIATTIILIELAINLLQNFSLMKNLSSILLVLSVFFLKKSITLTKTFLYTSMVFLLFYFVNYYQILNFSIHTVILTVVLLIPKIILIYFLFKNTRSKII